MPTNHNEARPGDIAKTVFMPGDPLRAKYMAENFLDNPRLVNNVRGMLGYTGTYLGKEVSVMGSGMGIPSIGIYSHELYTHYDVDTIVRVGTAGSYAEDLELYDVLLVTESFSDSTYAKCFNGFEGNVIPASEGVCQKLRESAKRRGIPVIEGRTHSSDVIYYQRPESETPYWIQVREQHGCICVEMECFALYHNANVLGKNAACMLTISDQKSKLLRATPEEREKSFTKMMEVAFGIL